MNRRVGVEKEYLVLFGTAAKMNWRPNPSYTALTPRLAACKIRDASIGGHREELPYLRMYDADVSVSGLRATARQAGGCEPGCRHETARIIFDGREQSCHRQAAG